MSDMSVDNDNVDRVQRTQTTEEARPLTARNDREIAAASDRSSGQRAAREVAGADGDQYRNVDEEARTKVAGMSLKGMQQTPSDLGTMTAPDDGRGLGGVDKSDPVLKRGDRKPEVGDLQRRLNQIDPSLKLQEDSNYGKQTEDAVRAQQSRLGLKPDGRADPATRDALTSPTAKQFQTEQSFARLDEKAREEATERLEAQAQNPNARRNVVDMVRGSGFGQLGSDQQRQMLEAQAKNPGDRTHTDDLSQLAANEKFRALEPKTQSTVIDAVGRTATDASARDTVSRMATSPGFGQLQPNDQSRMLDYLGGNNDISRSGRYAADRMMRSQDFGSAAPVEQAKQLNEFLNKQPGAPGTAQPQNGYGPPAPYTLTPIKGLDQFNFPSGAAPANRHMMEIDGRQIPIISPKSTDPSLGHTHSPEDIARGIASIPKQNRDLINQAIINPGANPADAHWQNVYGDPKHRSYMTAGSDGVIRVYPTTNPQSDRATANALVHETGHTDAYQRWGGPGSQGWSAWQQAMASDKLRPSDYAKSSPAEDYSESLVWHQAARGNAASAAEMRRLFPERYRILEGIWGR